MATLSIPIAKSEGSLEIDLEKVPDAVYQYALALGLKAILNRGMSKITKALMPSAEIRKTEAQLAAEKNLQAVYDGKVRMTGGVKPKVSKGAENTEAMRLAKITVKDTIKASGGKISHYASSAITEAAKELVAADASYLEQARKNLAERVKPSIAIDVSKIAVSAAKVKAAEAKKAKPKAEGQLSAKQAGKVKTKVPSKGQQPRA